MKIKGQKIPENSGVYFFREKGGKVLYIGKAVNLRNRIGSYFNKQPKDSRISKMLERAMKIDWQETASEIEALILESRLIKKHRPPFNIIFRDDKQYFYVGITKEGFPKVFITHRPKARSQKPEATLVGPFTDGQALKTTLKLLRRIFPYCACKQKHNNHCLNYHIGKCLGFCCLKQQKPGSRLSAVSRQRKEYLKNIKVIREILSGRRAALIKKLKQEMLKLGEKHNFEEAIRLRDKTEKLEKVFENAQTLRNANLQIRANATNNEKAVEELKKLLKSPNLPHRIEGYDVSSIQGKFAVGAMVVFVSGMPNKSQYRKFKMRLNNEPNDVAMLREILIRRFNHPEWLYPDLIIVDGGMAQLNTARSAISGQISGLAMTRDILRHRKSLRLAMLQKQIPIIALVKDKKHRGSHIFTNNKKTATLLNMLPENAKNLILQINAEAHRFAIGYYRKLHEKTAKS